MKKTHVILITLGFSLALLGPIGCHSQTRVDAWRRIPTSKGVAWHNEAFQQTVFDADSDGRIDRLRVWIGSGLAEEWLDDNLDGWFENYIATAYGKERERKQLHTQVPDAPVTDASGSYKRP